MVEIAQRYRDRANVTKIISRSVWRKGMETAEDLLTPLSDPGEETGSG
jgi:UDP-sulfoquinovose synthase